MITLDRIGCGFAVVALLCVLSVFFFPAMQGPYSVVHGPVTALLAVRAAAHLRLTIQAGLNALRLWLACALALTSWALTPIEEFRVASLSAGNGLVLRC
ncbi:MAG: hypothetical protein WAM79_23685 [Candidatus Sulfotelmatobacter sp.]